MQHLNTGHVQQATMVINSYHHYDCVNAGYAIAQRTFRNFKNLKNIKDYIEQSKIVAIKFECKEIGAKYNGISSRYL